MDDGYRSYSVSLRRFGRSDVWSLEDVSSVSTFFSLFGELDGAEQLSIKLVHIGPNTAAREDEFIRIKRHTRNVFETFMSVNSTFKAIRFTVETLSINQSIAPSKNAFAFLMDREIERSNESIYPPIIEMATNGRQRQQNEVSSFFRDGKFQQGSQQQKQFKLFRRLCDVLGSLMVSRLSLKLPRFLFLK